MCGNNHWSSHDFNAQRQRHRKKLKAQDGEGLKAFSETNPNIIYIYIKK